MSTPPPSDQPGLTIDQSINQMIQVARFDVNLTQEVFVTTVDKARLCLNEALEKMERRNAWVAPAGILATLVATFATATFRDFLLSQDTWRALFVLATIFCTGWLIEVLRKRPKSPSVDSVIEDLRKGSILNPLMAPSQISANSTPALPYPSAKGELIIHSAKYGANDKTIDVTSLLGSQISSGRLKVPVSNNSLGGDPLPNVLKELTVNFSYAGQTRSITIPEGGVLSLPLHDHPENKKRDA